MARYEKYELGISTKRIKTLVNGIREGMPIKYACDLAFIYQRQYQRWMAIYREFLENFDENDKEQVKINEIPVDDKDNLIYSKLNIITLCHILTHARADCLQTYLKNLKIDPDHYQRWSWLLERTYRKEFGKDVVEEAPTKVIERIKVEYVNPEDDNDRLARLEQEVEESIGVDGNNY